MSLRAALFLLPALLQAQPPLQPLPAALSCQYGVIGLRAAQWSADTLQVSRLVPGSPAQHAGLQPGDLLLGALPYRLRTREELSRYIQSKAPGDSVSLLLLRQGQYLQMNCRITDRRTLYSFMGEEGRLLPSLDQPRLQSWDGHRDPLEKGVRNLLQRHQSTPELERLIAAFSSEDSSYGADCRLSVQRFALLHPLKTRRVAEDLSTASQNRDLDALLLRAAVDLDLDLPLPDRGDLPDLSSPLLAQLKPFYRAGCLVQQALAPLDAAQQQELQAQVPPLLRYLSQHPALDQVDSTQDEQLRRTLRLAKAVDLPMLFAAARELASLSRPATLKKIKSLASAKGPIAADLPPGISGSLLYAQPSPWGWIVVGDRGPNQYEGPIALVVDLGGDDTYDPGGTPLVRLCIDYRGNDRYLGYAATGITGVSLNLDLQGDDQYCADLLGQGAAFCGVGMLVDLQGSDTYTAQEYAQGAAFFGAGLLLDEEGDDRYSAAQHSQGFGSMRGLGLLRDRRGADHYLADLQIPSTYGDPGLFEGWSQGVGCGVRGYGEGGIGLLLDLAGDDRYQGGNFSQGVGYFFGLGVLVDQRGNDLYLGSRFAQGAAAHQAVGVLADLSGKDSYLSQVAAGQGSAWNASVGLLFDQQGDDQYRADDLSQGAGAMNGLGLLLDQQGGDTYQARSGQGEGGSLEYWAGRSAPNLGMLMDWAGEDTYNLGGRKDQAEFKNPGIGLFEDR